MYKIPKKICRIEKLEKGQKTRPIGHWKSGLLDFGENPFLGHFRISKPFGLCNFLKIICSGHEIRPSLTTSRIRRRMPWNCHPANQESIPSAPPIEKSTGRMVPAHWQQSMSEITWSFDNNWCKKFIGDQGFLRTKKHQLPSGPSPYKQHLLGYYPFLKQFTNWAQNIPYTPTIQQILVNISIRTISVIVLS